MTNVEMFRIIAESGEQSAINACINNFEKLDKRHGLYPDAKDCLHILKSAQTTKN